MFENKNNILSKGNWLEIKVSSTGKSYKLEKDPVGCVLMRSGIVILPKGYHVLGVFADVDNIAASEKSIEIKYFEDGTQGFTLPSKTSFESMVVWVFTNKR